MDKRPLRHAPDDPLRPGQTRAGGADESPLAWLAQHGLIALLPVEESPAVDANTEQPRAAPQHCQEPGTQPEAALRIRLSAQKLWAEGRANPVSWVCRTWIGDWSTDDRIAWTTADGVWLARLERSANGRRVFLRIWREQTYLGYQDDVGWHPATSQRRRRSRPGQASLPLLLAG